MDQLLKEIADLEQKETGLQAQLEQTTTNEAKEKIVNEINILTSALNERRELLSKHEQREAIVAEASDPLSSFSLSAGKFVADFRALTKGEDEYQMASVTTRLYLDQLEREHKAEIKAIENSFYADLAAASEKNDALEGELEQTRADLADVRGKLEIANNKITDLEIERDSAVKEAEALRKQVEELRLQITEKPNVATNLDGASELAEINARLEAKKIPVYNVRAGDHKTSFYLAQLAETGEEIEIRPYYDLKSKYREVSDEEAARFQSELEAAKPDVPEAEELVSSDLVVEDTTIPLPPQFQIDTIQEYTVDGEVDAEETPIDGGRRENEAWEAWVERTLYSLGNRLTALDDQFNEAPPTRKAS